MLPAVSPRRQPPTARRSASSSGRPELRGTAVPDQTLRLRCRTACDRTRLPRLPESVYKLAFFQEGPTMCKMALALLILGLMAAGGGMLGDGTAAQHNPSVNPSDQARLQGVWRLCWGCYC